MFIAREVNKQLLIAQVWKEVKWTYRGSMLEVYSLCLPQNIIVYLGRPRSEVKQNMHMPKKKKKSKKASNQGKAERARKEFGFNTVWKRLCPSGSQLRPDTKQYK